MKGPQRGVTRPSTGADFVARQLLTSKCGSPNTVFDALGETLTTNLPL